MRLLLRIIFLAVMLAILAAMPVDAAGKVIMVSLGETSLQQLYGHYAMKKWLEAGSLALVNTGTAVRAGSEHVYVTMSASARATGHEQARLAFNVREEFNGVSAGLLYRRHMGTEAGGKVVFPGFLYIEQANRLHQYSVIPGLLGETLEQNGKTAAVLGNADDVHPRREAAGILANRTGQVLLGEVSRELLRRDNLFPYGWRLDADRLWETFSNLYGSADVILIDWGDTVRLAGYRPNLLPDIAARLEDEVFLELDVFLHKALKLLSGNDLLLLFSALPPERSSGADLLGYVLAVGKDYPPGGLLGSATTQREGLVTLLDFAPSVLQHLEIPVPGDMLGKPFFVPAKGSPSDLLLTQQRIDRINRLRPPLLRVYVLLQIVVVLSALVNLFAGIFPPRWFEMPFMALLLFPLVVLLLPLYRLTMATAFVVTFIALAAAVVLVCRLFRRIEARFAFAGLVTSAAIVADVLWDARLMKMSVLGYDPVSGARYYGLGNEYMGILVGATIFGASALLALLPRGRRVFLTLLGAYCLMITFLLVLPGGGANFGGTLTALLAFAVTLPALWGYRFTTRDIWKLLLAAAVFSAVAVWVNLKIPEQARSHLGDTLILIRESGWAPLWEIIRRKAAMNARLFRYSQWSRAFLVFLSVMTVLFFRPRGILAHVRQHHRELSAGFLGIITGSITAFFTNDSGVVAAATTLLFAGVPLICLCGRIIQEKTARPDI